MIALTRRRPIGFTLLEVVAAILLTAMVAGLAHRLLDVTLSGVQALRWERRALDRRENARRWLRAAFHSLQPDAPGGFTGRPTTARFSTWLEQPEGWFALEPVELMADGTLRARLPRSAIVLADSVVAVEFDYLLETGSSSRWVPQWHSPVTAPLAVRLRLLHPDRMTVDTVVCLIGARG